MNFDRYTQKSQSVIASAQKLAESRRHAAVEPAHVLAALLDEPSPALKALQQLQWLSVCQEVSQAQLRGLPQVSAAAAQNVSHDLARVFQAAEKETRRFEDSYVTVEHLLLGLLDPENAVGRVLKERGLTPELLLPELKKIRGNAKAQDPSAEDKYEALEKYSKDLTALAREGKLDPVIGRDEEIRRVIQVLSRRTKNNPVLIGEPGVGKTAIAEGLASRIVKGDVPEGLKGKSVRSLDLGSMLAGAKYRGEFEERLKAFLKEVQDSHGEIVLFIDELHTLIGAGKTDGAMDAGNLLKPALARGELRCVGATTLDEYRKYVEKDPALERRFQQVFVGEPSVEDTISILRGLKEKYEVHHGVRIQDQAIVNAAVLSHRYIADRFLPDKAIDLMDEAAAKLRIEIDSMPAEIDEKVRHTTQLEVERQSLLKEKDAASLARLASLDAELGSLKEEVSKLQSHWMREKEQIGELRRLKEEGDRLQSQLEIAERNSELQRAAEIKYGRIPELKKSAEKVSAKLREIQTHRRMLKEEVEAEDVAQIVARWTGIPVDRLLKGENEKLLKLEETLRSRVRGQDEALSAVADAVRLARSGLKDPTKPIGSFLFLGPTGVGKTETAKALAEFLFDHEQNMVRIDMSEYMEKHSTARLIGAPPGYVGFDEGGQLTEAVRRRPYSVILFDEIEKGHPDVLNVLLQVLDDGRLTDGQGRLVDFRNTVVIMTSNIGATLLLESTNVPREKLKKQMMELLRESLRPEFINRIDEIVLFNSLNQDLIRQIVDIQLKDLNRMLKDKRLSVSLSDGAKDFLGSSGFDPLFGARPLKRTIYKELQVPLSRALLKGDFIEGDEIEVQAQGGALVMKARPKA
jgi:ATP-dependent Clp protease ATP-binding subunit ClpB